jgi:hypothetical protein
MGPGEIVRTKPETKNLAIYRRRRKKEIKTGSGEVCPIASSGFLYRQNIAALTSIYIV